MKKLNQDFFRLKQCRVYTFNKTIASVLLVCFLFATNISAQVPITFTTGRFALSHDGNKADKDDVLAVAMTYALLASSGVADRLVHVSVNCNLGGISQAQYQQMKVSLAGHVNFPGFSKEPIYFDDQTQLTEAIANFKKEAEKGSANNILNFCCGGPMEVPWQMINAVDPAKRKFIRIVSHSNWNNTHVEPPKSTHTMNHIKADFVKDGLLVADLDINGLGSANWNFMKTLPEKCGITNAAWTWVTTREYGGDGGVGDVSDSVMSWYVLTGKLSASASDYEARFRNPVCVVGTAVENVNASEKNIHIYPNPVSNILSIDFLSPEISRKIKVFNMVGQLIHSVTTNDASAKIDIKSLNLSSIAMVQVNDGKTVSNHRVIVK